MLRAIFNTTCVYAVVKSSQKPKDGTFNKSKVFNAHIFLLTAIDKKFLNPLASHESNRHGKN
jgi:hypothetical protein